MPFLEKGLYRQLRSEGYTKKQARYGVRKSGLAGSTGAGSTGGAVTPELAECYLTDEPTFTTRPSEPIAYRANEGHSEGIVWPVLPWTDRDEVLEELGTWDVSWFFKGEAKIKYSALCADDLGGTFKKTVTNTEVVSVWDNPESDPWVDATPYARYSHGFQLKWSNGGWALI